MNKNKQTISTIVMILILFFMTGRQLIQYIDYSSFNVSSMSFDLTLIVIISVLTFILSIFIIYLPLLFIVKFDFYIQMYKISLPRIIKETKVAVENIFFTVDRYKKLSVFRC